MYHHCADNLRATLEWYTEKLVRNSTDNAHSGFTGEGFLIIFFKKYMTAGTQNVAGDPVHQRFCRDLSDSLLVEFIDKINKVNEVGVFFVEGNEEVIRIHEVTNDFMDSGIEAV